MPLKPNMTIDEIKQYLEGDLKQSIKNDIYPILQPEKEEGGYFGVARLVLCYIDFLGALYSGYEDKTDKGKCKQAGGKATKRRPEIATSKKAKTFIKDILGSVDSHYEEYADLLYEMYRHGTVHLYAPKVLKRKRDGRELRWLLYKGDRESSEKAGQRVVKVRHMQPIRRNGRADWLPVSITCLYDDLNAAIDRFRERLEREPELRCRWKSTARALRDPDEISLGWSTRRSACPSPAAHRP